ncbi:MAG TPA: NAD(P)-dependent oxidoreductase, partial [Chloroflexi bacterium]|nr:NAD(P)-dependent oxidoreductase [Chloroflexota bacterium]
MTKVLVTGASGRFAEYVVKSLRDDYELVLFSRSPLPEDRADLPWVQGDLNDFEACRRAVEGIDVIQHLGAVPWPSDNPAARARVAERGRELPPFDATMRTNIMGTYYLMRAAVEAGVQTVVMAGSNCAFGHCSRLSCTPYPVRYLPLDEEHPSDVQESYDY